ncbi:hypothetical protein HNQ91_000694 [Filimonas zeae]|uniref:Uncharacterized protein n=1 Tax=Filimonas zeae TaxID=1737353 RepID=A0A917MRX1_9BACT|nr:hypothetical protein [Filimonas zeae]MDR6337672.1 hypothetical protein [Filimonas zeae]GGH59728.1 hypothetical protein GCM10011379_06820 [Filimonas zeae]
MESQEKDRNKKIVVAGELPFVYDANEPAVQKMLERSEETGNITNAIEVKIIQAKSKIKKNKTSGTSPKKGLFTFYLSPM